MLRGVTTVFLTPCFPVLEWQRIFATYREVFTGSARVRKQKAIHSIVLRRCCLL
jgi:hypothetical protein